MREFFANLEPSDWIALSAVVIAVASFAWTAWNSWQLGKLNRREHDWQATDRVTAHVQVTRWRENLAQSSHGNTSHRVHDWIRLTNTGRAIAHRVTWSLDPSVIRGDHPKQLDRLHPGEHFDLGLILTMNIGGIGTLDVEWSDEHGTHETSRMINL